MIAIGPYALECCEASDAKHKEQEPDRMGRSFSRTSRSKAGLNLIDVAGFSEEFPWALASQSRTRQRAGSNFKSLTLRQRPPSWCIQGCTVREVFGV